MSTTVLHSSAVMGLLAMRSDVGWAYLVFALVAVAWLVVTLRDDGWSKARGLDKLVLLGPLFYAAPLAAFGTEHFTQAAAVASLVPDWIPWHRFWTYFVGACFIAAGLSVVTRIRARLSASLLALTFFLFVLLMDLPGWAQNPKDRFALTLALRQLSFCGGALALTASLTAAGSRPSGDILGTIARYFIAVPVLVFGIQQFMHGDYVPGIPLNRVTPEYVPGHSVWTYLTAVIYVLAGGLLLAGKKARAAATLVGLTVLFLVLVVYVPIGVVDRATLVGFNYPADTLMFCGAVLLLAGALPQEAWRREPSARSLPASG